MVTLELLNEKVEKMQHKIDRVLELLEEKDLTDEAKKDLEEARATPHEKYVSHDEVKNHVWDV